MFLVDSLSIVDNVTIQLKSVQGDPGNKVNEKLDKVLLKNIGL